MLPTRFLLRQPMIQFLGKRSNLPKRESAIPPRPLTHQHKTTRGPRNPQPSTPFSNTHRTAEPTDPKPHPHPASPTPETLPTSFASYRQKAQQHGPLQSPTNTSFAHPAAHGKIGGTPGAELGAVQPQGTGVFFDRSELPKRFARTAFSAVEMEAVESGGASMFG